LKINNHLLDTEDKMSDSSDTLNTAGTIRNAYLPERSRHYFDSSMYDALGHVIIVKVFSHQLNDGFTTNYPTKQPRYNLFVVYANQAVDNAVTQARDIIKTATDSFHQISYPPFSPH